jgi:hypothetical protein
VAVQDLDLGVAMRDPGPVDGLGLAEAIESLRDDLLKARAAGATSGYPAAGRIHDGRADRNRD